MINDYDEGFQTNNQRNPNEGKDLKLFSEQTYYRYSLI